MALPVVPKLLWALVPQARDARPGSVKGEPPLPLDQGCKSKRPRLRCQGGPQERATASDFTCCALLHSGHTRGFPISLQSLPSMIFIYPKVEKTPCCPLVHPHA